MKAESQQIAIAEAHGWGLIEYRDCEITGDRSWLSGLNPNPDVIVAVIEADTGIARKPNESDYGFESIPDYLKSLDLLRAAEKSLGLHNRENNGLRVKWVNTLRAIVAGVLQGAISDVDLLHATAAQRAEAFLRAIGKWVEDERSAS